MKHLILVLALLFASFTASAATLQVNWSASTNPDSGFNVYLAHYSTPAAIAYQASTAPSSRSILFHNIQDGVYTVAVSRVDYYADGPYNRRIESNVVTVNVIIANGICTVLSQPVEPFDVYTVFDPDAT